MLISVLVAIYTLGISRGKKMKDVMNSVSMSVSSITMVLLIISGAGALKQILIDSGVSNYIGSLLEGSLVSPLILAWLIATVIRSLCWFSYSSRFNCRRNSFTINF